MKIAAIADLHCRTNSAGEMRELLEGVERAADLLVIAGDLTNMGLPNEMEVLLGELRKLSLPTVAVLGNHDHESDRVEQLSSMLKTGGVFLLDGGTCIIDGVGFIGTKGFCGGFGKLAVQPFGERTLKKFIRASIEEAKLLEHILDEMDSARKVAILHYAPVEQTLAGEERELYPFLGSSLLADALDRKGVDVVIHGHAHNGSTEGKTPGGIPVHNVCRFVRKRMGLSPYLVLEV